MSIFCAEQDCHPWPFLLGVQGTKPEVRHLHVPASCRIGHFRAKMPSMAIFASGSRTMLDREIVC